MARFRAASTGTACLLALTLLLAACGGGEDESRTAAGPSSSVPDTTPTTTVETTSSTVAPATTTTRRGAATTRRPAASSPAGPAGPAGPAAGPAAVKPPAGGTYRYTTSGSTTFGLSTIPFPGVTTLVVDPPAGTRQHSTRDLRDAAGVGPVTEFTLDYRADGVYLESLRLTTSAGTFTDTRELRPPAPALFLPTGARPGTSLAVDLPTAAGVAKVTVDVLGEEQVVVGGRGVDTLQVRVVATLPPGETTGRQELTLNVDRVSGLWVRERSVTDASAANGLLQLHSQYEATLTRLIPA